MYNDSGFFYYSNTFDLTNSLQRQNQSTDTLTKPLWKRADERFFWNKHMLVDLIDDEVRSLYLSVSFFFFFFKYK